MEEANNSVEKKPEEQTKPKKRKKLLWIIFTIIALVGIGWFFLWYFYLRFEESTDDAYVRGNQIELQSQIEGTVTAIYAEETDLVQEGQLLVELSTVDAENSLKRAKDQLALTVREVAQIFTRVRELEEALKLREAALVKAKQDYENRLPLVEVGGVSGEDFQHAEAFLREAEASLGETWYQLKASKEMIQGTTLETHPKVLVASDQVRDAYVWMNRTKIYAPATGIIAQRKLQVGESVNPSTPLLAVVPLDQIWVNANFKETQLGKIRPGQPVILHADMYGRGVKFHGTVEGFNAGTGNVFSILPPQNATGNWIKIVQRLPVRIRIDPADLKKHPLMLGLSMHAKVDIAEVDGSYLPEKPSTNLLYNNFNYNQQLKGVESLIQEIIQKNKP